MHFLVIQFLSKSAMANSSELAKWLEIAFFKVEKATHTHKYVQIRKCSIPAGVLLEIFDAGYFR